MSEHTIAPRTYFVVFGVLILLLIATVVVADYDFGVFNPVIAMGIAATKALVIALYFMHLRYTFALSRVFAFGGLLWLGIAMVFTMSDYLTRDWLGPASTHARPEAVDRSE